jgi:hypothetical protein
VNYGTKDLRDRILKNIEYDLNGGCWLWRLVIDKHGYGQIGFDRARETRAHRYSYKAFVGEVPQGLLVRHKCDVRSCVNPTHLFLGTHQDNMDDMKARSRQARRAAPITENRNRRLGPEKAALIYQADGSSNAIAAQFGAEPSMVRRIRRGDSWSSVTSSLTRGQIVHVSGRMGDRKP